MILKNCLAAFLALFLAVHAFAAVTTADRSPFAQGHWWDPSRAGHGFELFNAADQVAIVWYTYDELGAPVWYNAQSPAAAMGQPWPLMRQRWSEGRLGAATLVGSIKLTANHPESMRVDYTIGSNSGTTTIQPFVASGVISEVDHTGHWYDPAQSGWGFTLTEQGPVLGSVLYTYDASGSPTWLAGFGRQAATRTVELFAVNGYCPYCTPRLVTNRSVGTLRFEYESEAQLTVRSSLSFAMAPGIAIEGARAKQLGRPVSWRLADRQLATFKTAAALEAYLREGVHNISPITVSGGIDFSPAPAPAAAAYSQTNLQEAGVDEADLVKTDGRYIYAFRHDALGARLPSIRILEVTGEGAQVVERAVAGLGEANSTVPVANAGLFLHGDKLVAVTGNVPITPLTNAWMPSPAWTLGKTYVEILSASNPLAARWRLDLDGYLVATRRIGDRLYLASRFVPQIPGFRFTYSYANSLTLNQAVVNAAPYSAFLPKMRVNGGAAVDAVSAESVHTPPPGSRPAIADMILITAIDLGEPRVAQVLGIVGSVETFYAATGNLYVASARMPMRSSTGVPVAVAPSYYTTDIHQIRLGATSMSVSGSASVEGFLAQETDQAPFRLSEHDGRLRVVTSDFSMTTWWGGGQRNRLTVLEPSTVTPGLLKTVGYLPNDARPETLGKPNELLYATRFVGERLYAVTFRMTDPLYVVDLATPADPKITGALEVPGFSEYLHPLPNNMLLGFGKYATPTGLFQGLQVSLFDVRDAGKPRQVQSVILGERNSESALLRSHHALASLIRPDGSGTFAFPARIYGTSGWLESGLMRFRIDPALANPLVGLPSLITHSRNGGSISPPASDASTDEARSILFPNGTVYVGKGQVWRQDTAGVTTGPL